MPQRKTYGKRPTTQERRVAEIFQALSSPAKPSPLRALRDTPDRRKRLQGVDLEGSELQKDAQSRSINADAVTAKLDSLQLADGSPGRKAPGNSQTLHSTGRVSQTPALGERDVNAASKPPHRRQRKVVASSDTEEEAVSVLEKKPVVQQGVTKPEHHPTPSKEPQRATPSPARKRLIKSKRKLSLGPKPSPLGETSTEDSITTYAQPLLRLCEDAAITPFDTYATALSGHFTISKNAEASYGEVYRLSLRKPSPTLMLQSTDASVLKIVALKPPPALLSSTCTAAASHKAAQAAEAMSSIPDIANEVRLLQHMTPIPGFTNFRCLTVAQGRMPPVFVKAWRNYNSNVKRSLFPDPGRKASYPENQLWAVLEMQDAGPDLESVIEAAFASREDAEGVMSPPAVWDIFWSVAGAVAKGEEYAAFEHRDLHIGNICVRPSRAPSTEATVEADVLNPLSKTLNTSRTLGFTDLEATIIDYTLSRAELRTVIADTDTSTNDPIAFFDLSKDDAIFEGDAAEEYQYEMYRYMRGAVLAGDPTAASLGRKNWRGGKKATKAQKEEKMLKRKEGEKAAWRSSHLMTNLVWLHFVLEKMMDVLVAPGVSTAVVPIGHAVDPLAMLDATLRLRLHKLRQLLAIEGLAKGNLQSAVHLVEWAVAEGWLCKEDVLGLGH